MDLAFDYTNQSPLQTEDSYPYTGQDGQCQADGSGKIGASSHSDIPPNDPDQLRAAVSRSPVSIAIEADQGSFQGYSGGILNSADCGTQLDHGVLILVSEPKVTKPTGSSRTLGVPVGENLATSESLMLLEKVSAVSTWPPSNQLSEDEHDLL